MEHAAQQNTKAAIAKKQEHFSTKKNEQPFFAPAFIQPKLKVSPANDPYEREADAVADKVMNDTGIVQTKISPVNVQRKCAHCEEEEKQLQRKPAEETVQSDAPSPAENDQTRPYLHLSITVPASEKDNDSKINYGEANLQLIEQGINTPADYTVDYSNLWKADYQLSQGLRLGTMVKNLYGMGERFDAKALRPVRGVVKKIPLVGGLLKDAIKFEAPKVEGGDWDKYMADKMGLSALKTGISRDHPEYNDVSGVTFTINIIDTHFDENNIGKLFRKPASATDNAMLQRKCNSCEAEEKINRKENSTVKQHTETHRVEQTLESGGQPMDAATQSFMEQRFGYDFSQVQIHNDALAHNSSADINALAYTHGNHIVFGHGKYQPDSYSGKQLLAHELTHVVQQGGAVNATDLQSVSGSSSVANINVQKKNDESGAAGCPRVPTNEGKQAPDPACPVATHIGATELLRVQFCEDSSQAINPGQLSGLNNILAGNPGSTHFIIHGYASIEGDPAYNFKLSCHRANSVAGALSDALRLIRSGVQKERVDAEIASRIETGAQGPTTEFSSGLSGNRIAVVYGQVPGGAVPDEPACKDAPKHIGDVTPETNCDTATMELMGKDGSEQLRYFYFCEDSDVISGEGVDAIRKYAYKQSAASVFVVHGFASEEGNEAYNKRLSCNRALRIARELMNAGVRADQLKEVSGLGETTTFSEREFNRTAIAFAQDGKIAPLAGGPRKTDTPQQKQKVLDEVLKEINAGQYQLEADAYISFWTCGKTKTVREAVKRLHILLPAGNEDELIRDKANGKEEGLDVNTVRLSNTAFHADNAIECVTGRIIDMAFHHAVIQDAGLSPDLANFSNPEPRHMAGLHLVALAGFSSCTGKHASAGEVPGRSLTGIDEPLSKDPRAGKPAPLCAQAPQPARLLTPAKGIKDQEKPDFIVFDKQYEPLNGKLLTSPSGTSSDSFFLTKGNTNMANLSATVSLTGKPDSFANYEVGFVQTILDDLTLAEYASGHIAVQRLPVPVRAAGMKNDPAVPAPWTALSAFARPDANGQLSVKSGWNLHTEAALLLNFFKKDIGNKDLLDTWSRHTTVGLWLVARRLGAPLDRFSLVFIDGCTYNLSQNFNVDIRRMHGDIGLPETTIGGEHERFAGVGSFVGSKTSEEQPDSRMAQLGNPVAGGIDLRRQFEKILEPTAATEESGVTRDEYQKNVQEILDNLVVFNSDEDFAAGTNGQVMPRLGFVFTPLTITIFINRQTGRMVSSLAEDENISAKIESVSMGERTLHHLRKALVVRLSKRDFLNKGNSAVLKPSAIPPGTEPVTPITFTLPPMLPEIDLIKDSTVLHDMAELWACSELTNEELDTREFAIAYWMDRDQNLHRIPEDGILAGEPDDMSGSIKTLIPCGPTMNSVGFGMGHVHTHPVDDEDSPLPSEPDKELVKDGKCGRKFYIVSKEAVVSYFASGGLNNEGKRTTLLPRNVKCDPKRWRSVKKNE